MMFILIDSKKEDIMIDTRYATNEIKLTDQIRILRKNGEKVKLGSLILGTTYTYQKGYGRALECICIFGTREVVVRDDLYCIQDGENFTYAYKDPKGNISLYATDPFSKDVFQLLFLCASELSCNKTINDIVSKLYIHSLSIGWNDVWDAFHQEDAIELAALYVEYIEEMIQDERFYWIKKHELFSKDFKTGKTKQAPDTSGILFQEREDLSHLAISYTKEDLNQMPTYLIDSIQDNIQFYQANKDTLDKNAIQVIKAFAGDYVWAAGYYGPSGTGKTTTAKLIAGALCLPIIKVTGSRNIDEAYLFGKYILKNGDTEFSYGPLSLAMKHGALFLFDEINMIEGDVLSSLNDVLEMKNGKKILENGEQITAHRAFRFIETMNIGYAGTNDINLSHKSRIQLKVKISKLSMEQNIQIVLNNSSINRTTAKKMIPFIEKVNDMINESGNEFAQRIDIRNIINWANLSVALDNDYIHAAIPTIVAGLLEEDITIDNSELEDILLSDSLASNVMSQIIDTMK